MQNSTKVFILLFTLLMAVIFTPRPGEIVIAASPSTTTTTTSTTIAHVTTSSYPEPRIETVIVRKWEKVALCETGSNWHTRGPIYSGGLGILESNWRAYGGQRLFGNEWSASAAEQIYIAIRIQALNGYAGYVPDQYGCGHGW